MTTEAEIGAIQESWHDWKLAETRGDSPLGPSEQHLGLFGLLVLDDKSLLFQAPQLLVLSHGSPRK